MTTTPAQGTPDSATAHVQPPSSSTSPYAPTLYPALSYQPAQPAEKWWHGKEFFLMIFGMAFTGVSGYFAAQWTLKESITTLQSQVQILAERVSVMRPAVDSIPVMQKDIAVLETKLQAITKDKSRRE